MRASATALLLLRLLVALSPSYIHPDEWFQSSEVAAAQLWSNRAFVPWEFANCQHPCRALSVGLPLAALRTLTTAFRWLGDDARWLVLLPRVWLWLGSIAVDRTIAATCAEAGGVDAASVALLYATSWVSLVLMSRPLSNTLEAWALAVLLLLHVRLVAALRRGAPRAVVCFRAAALGACAAAGCFVRFTFVAFAAPVAVASAWHVATAAYVSRHARPGGALVAATTAAAVTVAAAAAAVAAAACLAVADSLFFGSLSVAWVGWRALPPVSVTGRLVWAPLANAAYNLDAGNLAAHGTHARWTHALVNGPLMFGPLWLAAAVLAARAAWAWVRRAMGAQSTAQRDGPHAAAARRPSPGRANRASPSLAAPARGSRRPSPRRRGAAQRPSPQAALDVSTPHAARRRRRSVTRAASPSPGAVPRRLRPVSRAAGGRAPPPIVARCGGDTLPRAVGASAVSAAATPAVVDLPCLCAAIVASGLCALSTAPHQEPRFLAPLLLPLAVLGAAAAAAAAGPGAPPPLPAGPRAAAAWCRRSGAGGVGALRRAAALAAWLAFNLAVGAVFGVLHQAGVFPATAALGDALRHAESGAPLPVAGVTVGFETRPWAAAGGRVAARQPPVFWGWGPLTRPAGASMRAALAAAANGTDVASAPALLIVFDSVYMAPVSLLRLRGGAHRGGHVGGGRPFVATWCGEGAAAADAGTATSAGAASAAAAVVAGALCTGAPPAAPSPLCDRVAVVDLGLLPDAAHEAAVTSAAAPAAPGAPAVVVAPASRGASSARTVSAWLASTGSGGSGGRGEPALAASFWPHLSTEAPPSDLSRLGLEVWVV